MREKGFAPIILIALLLATIGAGFVIYKIASNRQLPSNDNPPTTQETRTVYVYTCNDNNPEAAWTIKLDNTKVATTHSKDTSHGKAPVGTFCETAQFQTQQLNGNITVARTSEGEISSVSEVINIDNTPYIYVFSDMRMDSSSEPKQFYD